MKVTQQKCIFSRSHRLAPCTLKVRIEETKKRQPYSKIFKGRKEGKMKAKKRKQSFLTQVAGIILALFVGAGFPAVQVQAASGTVYTCTIHPCYRHPVTGEIEDSGGEASYATGQGMVEGAVYPTGILELTDSGEYYLTIRMSLMSYTSGHSFWVQNVGDTGWATPALGVTGEGTDSNGATNDICIQVPSENCVVRGAMYVESMGRDVVFYLYPSDFIAGNNTDMNATIVTTASGTEENSGTGTSQSNTDGSQNTTSSGSSQTASSGSSGGTLSSSGLSASASAPEGASQSSGEESKESTQEVTKLENTIQDPADSSGETETLSGEDTELNQAQGLSLSTETEESQGSNGQVQSSSAAAIAAAVTVSGLILMGTAAVIVYFFRRNWRRWGGGFDDDEM